MTQIQFQNSLTSLHSKLYYFALSLTSDSDKARDLVQETYLKALTYRDKFSADTNLMAWVYTIMKNTFINEYRRNVKAKTTLESSSHKLQMSFSKDDYSPAADSIHAEKEIYKKIDLLENEFREPFQLFLSGFKYKEIAEKLICHLVLLKAEFSSHAKNWGNGLVSISTKSVAVEISIYWI